MRNLMLILMVCVSLGCGDKGISSPNVGLGNRLNSQDAQIKALEARIAHLEDWAVKRGGRLK